MPPPGPPTTLVPTLPVAPPLAVVCPSRQEAVAVQLAVDAALGYPRRGIPVARGVHVPPAEASTVTWREPVPHPVDDRWAYVVDANTVHLVGNKPLVPLGPDWQIDPETAESPTLAARPYTPGQALDEVGTLAGWLRVILGDVDAALYDDLDVIAVEFETSARDDAFEARLWRRSMGDELIFRYRSYDRLMREHVYRGRAQVSRRRYDDAGRFLDEAEARSQNSRNVMLRVPVYHRADALEACFLVAIKRSRWVLYPRLRGRPDLEGLFSSFLEAVLYVFAVELKRRFHEPTNRDWISAAGLDRPNLLADAAHVFLSAVLASCGDERARFRLFDVLDRVSSLPYESRTAQGTILFARPGDPRVELRVPFGDPVSLGEVGLVRKLLETSNRRLCLVSDGVRILGLGRIAAGTPEAHAGVYRVDFAGANRWRFCTSDGTALMNVVAGQPGISVPQAPRLRIRQRLKDEFAGIDDRAVRRLTDVVEHAVEQRFGTMVVISSRAAEEVERLRSYCLRLVPTRLSAAEVRSVSSIDGALLFDTDGHCHAMGFILDGVVEGDESADLGSAARGARFNSAKRYVESCRRSRTPVVVLVVSEDGKVDLL